jgi:hypothetical protein
MSFWKQKKINLHRFENKLKYDHDFCVIPKPPISKKKLFQGQVLNNHGCPICGTGTLSQPNTTSSSQLSFYHLQGNSIVGAGPFPWNNNMTNHPCSPNFA